MSILTKISSELNDLVGKDFQQKKYLLAVSGGLDSMVMLDIFKNFSLKFEVAHCNFKLRDNDSDLDEALIKDVCTKNNIVYHVQEFDTKGILKEEGGNLQETARNLRYNWFNSLLTDFDFLVTAHHLDDNIETFFLNLLRGAGVKGLAGIPQINNKTIRPFLSVSKQNLLDYAQDHDVIWREDESNTKNVYARNQLRNEILPKIKKIKENFNDVMSSNIYRMRSTNNLLDYFIQDIVKQVVQKQNDSIEINLNFIRTFPEKELILFQIISSYGFNFTQSKDILLSKQTGKLFHSNSHQALINRDKLIITKSAAQKHVNIQFDTINDFLNSEFVLEHESLDKLPETMTSVKNTLFLDLEKIEPPLRIRSWQNGDSIIPFGMRGKKKISDILIDNKVSLIEKHKVLLLEDSSKVLSILGIRNSEEVKVTEQTKKVLKVVTKTN